MLKHSFPKYFGYFLWVCICVIPHIGQSSNIDSLKTLIANTTSNDEVIRLQLQLANEYKTISLDSTLFFIYEAIELAKKNNNDSILGETYLEASGSYADNASFKESIEYGYMALKIFERANQTRKIAEAEQAIGYASYHNEDFDSAIKWWTSSRTRWLEINDSSKLARTCINLGAAYSNINNNQKSLELYEEALEYSSSGDQLMRADVLNNIGFALINEFSQTGDRSQLMKSVPYFTNARDLFLKNNDTLYYAYSLFNLGSVNLDLNQIDTAESQLTEALMLFRQLKRRNDMTTVFEILSQFYYKTGKYKLAYDYKDSLYKLETSIRTEEFDKAIVETEIKYQTNKREREKELLAKEKELLAIESDQVKKINDLMYLGIVVMGVGIVVLILLLALFIYQFIGKQKANRLLDLQNKTILSRNKEISAHRDRIRFQNSELISSINYARRIQEAVLPRTTDIQTAFEEFFILYLPKDIVSGDFYWLETTQNKIFWAVADCTGHGVPGAFLSILGATGLKKIVQEYQIHKPADILTQLSTHVLNSLKEAKDGVDLNDGMDIAICCWDKSTNTVEFAGAYNPLYIVKNGHVNITKATRRPIGSYSRKVETPFENHLIEVKKGDKLYIFSDGYIDQFGEIDEAKYSSDRFKKFIEEIHDKPMNEQQLLLDAEFRRWKGKEEQIDDICIFGVQI